MPTKKFDNCNFFNRSGHILDRLILELPPGVLPDAAAVTRSPSLSPDNRRFHTISTVPRARIGFDRSSQNYYPTGATACPSVALLWDHILSVTSITKHNISDSSQPQVLILGKSHGVQCFCAKSLANSKGPLSKPTPSTKPPSFASSEIRTTSNNQYVQNGYETPETVCPNFLSYRICAVIEWRRRIHQSAPFWAFCDGYSNEIVTRR